VLHFLPLHPYFIYKAITSLGIETKADVSFYKIPIQHIKNNHNAMYLYSKENYRGPAKDINDVEIRTIEMGEYKEMTEIPLATIEYYTMEKGKEFGLFPFIPHLLSRGEVAVNSVEIIQWSKP